MKLIVTGQAIEWAETRLMASGSDGIYTVEFEFNDDEDLPSWGGISKYAVFKNSALPQYPDGVYTPISEGVAEIPSCILTERGKFYVGVYGQNGYYTMPTIWASPVTIEAGCGEGENTVVPVQTSAQNAIKAAENAKVFSEGGYIVKRVNGTVDEPDLERLQEYTKGAKDYALDAYGSATDAMIAQGAAETAQGKAEDAQAAAEAAQGEAEDAQGAAETAQGKAEDAQAAAEAAQGRAEDAQAAIEAMQALAQGLAAGMSPTVTKTIVDGHVVLTFGIPKGGKGDKGDKGDTGNTGAAAGFGTPTATVDNTVGTPSVEVTASGPDTAKVFNFAFHNLKGADSVQEFLETGLYVDDGYVCQDLEDEE